MQGLKMPQQQEQADVLTLLVTVRCSRGLPALSGCLA